MPNVAAENSFTLEIERKDNKALVHCHGRLVAGAAKPLFDGVKPLIPECKLIVLDLAGVTFMDSMGLGALVRLHVSASGSGSRLELIHLGKQIRELLGLTHLLSVLTDMCEQGVTLRF
jgi:anti-sigma B factor antagonist